ncbi:hypothetical protein SELMODRAFT_426097 [Selaginella moellendorffii]|uniref:Uncharacterized protein n=1 Tax=Selaginella moellendorffii TaxID=88036 RepID=D8SVB1_SELML|nr:hypothetical protein SELMODRAFT_426097 [Selaginella moellendorffii]
MAVLQTHWEVLQQMVQKFLREGLTLEALEALDKTCDQYTFEEVLGKPWWSMASSVKPTKLLEKKDLMRDLGYKCGSWVFENLIRFLSETEPKDAIQSLFCEMIRLHPGYIAGKRVYELVLAHCSSEFMCTYFVAKEARAKGVDLLITLAQAYQIVLKAAKEVDVIIAIVKQAMFHGVTMGPSIRPFLTCAAIPENELLIATLKKGLINLCVGEYSIADAFFVLATKACYPLPQTLE